MSRSSPPQPQPRLKRKRAHVPAHNHISAEADKTRSSAKKQATDRARQQEYDESIAHMDPAMLSDHLAKNLTRHASDQSAIELEDQFIPASVIRDTSSFAEPRVSKHLPAFLEAVSRGRDELSTCAKVASPHTLVVTLSGIRAADLARELRTFATDEVRIAKLFAKHMKLQETVNFVQKTKVAIGVGTPTRLKELVERDAISSTAIRRIVIDGSYIDDKKRTIFDMKEIYLPLLQLLNLDVFKSRREASTDRLEIVIF